MSIPNDDELIPLGTFSGAASITDGYLRTLLERNRARIAALEAVGVTVRAGTPGPTNDSSDSAGIGVEFAVGARWLDTTSTTGAYYVCLDASVGAAEWSMSAPPFEGLWEDLRFPAQGINPPGQISPPTRDTETGLLVFENGQTQLIAGVAQMSHTWRQGSTVYPHVHSYAQSADPSGTGDVLWRFSWKWMNNLATIPAAYADVDQVQTLSDYSGGLAVLDVEGLGAGLDGTGMRDSSCIFWRLARIGGDVLDTYAGDVALVELDFHFQKNTLGSFSIIGDG